MQAELERLRAICVRIDRRGEPGSGYLTDARHVATCEHVVRGLPIGAEVLLRLGPDHAQCRGKLARVDARADCALVELDRPIEDAEPLQLARCVPVRALWSGYGYPALARGAGVPIQGELLDSNGRDPDQQPVLTLFSKQIAAGSGSPECGYSGSPVIVDGKIVGHIKRHIGDPDDTSRAAFGVLYACPSSAVAALLGRELPELEAPEIATRAVPPLAEDHYHVFISYRSSDEAWARLLRDALIGAGFKVFLAATELRPGDVLVRKLSDALARSRSGITLVSRRWLESDWCQEEASAMVNRSIGEANFRIVPIRLDDSPLPALLGNRIYVDLHEEAAIVRELEKIIAGLTGSELPPASPARRIAEAETLAADAFVARVRAAVNPQQVVRIVREWQAAGVDNVRPALVAAETLVAQNEPERALSVLDRLEPGLRVRQLRALAFGRMHRNDDAIAELQALRAAGALDAETGGLLAGRLKARARQSGDRAALRASYETYSETFELTADTYNGVNAATLALMCGEHAQAYDFARRVLDLLEPKGAADLDVWGLATRAEAHLVRGETDSARRWYNRAVARAIGLHSNIAVMRRQARLLLEALGRPASALDDVFPVPTVVAFSGHRVDEEGRPQPRFPVGKVGAVRMAIRERLEQLGQVHGYSGAAKGSDILFLEELLGRGGTASVVLPFQEDRFLTVSSDGHWIGRWLELRRRFHEDKLKLEILGELSPDAVPLGATFVAANLRVCERAWEYAERLDETPRPLVIWDGKPGDGPGGTAHAVQMWREEGIEPDIIDVSRL